MPKRTKQTKEDPEEPYHLLVVNAYPGRCTLDTDADKIDTSQWIASIIGKEQLLALFHRPGAENEIIIEVKKSCRDLGRLLGAHDWAKFVKNVSEEDSKHVSKVFFCRLKSGTEVEGAGWKRVFVKDQWFKNWNPTDNKFTYPYPRSHRCDVPVGTNPVHVSLALKLPVAMFPVAPPVPAPPVGSPAWIASRGATPSSGVTTTSKPLTNAWAKGGPIAMPMPSRPLVGSSAWASGPPLAARAVPVNTWGTRPTSILTPAGLPVPGAPALRAEAPSLSRTPNTSTPALSASITSSDDDRTGWWSPDVGGSRTASAGPPVAAAEPGRFEQAMASLSFRSALEHHQHAEHGGDDDDDFGMQNAIFAPSTATGKIVDSLWDADEGASAGASGEEKLVCELHGSRCSTGICGAYAEQRAEQRRREREAADKRGKKGKGRGWGQPRFTRDEDRDDARRNPRARDVQPKVDPKAKAAHLQAGDRARPSHLAADARAKPAHLGGGERRAKPAHLQKAASGIPQDDSDGGWQQVTRSSAANRTTTYPPGGADKDDARSVASSEPGDWEKVSDGPWNGSKAWGKRVAPTPAPAPASEQDDWESVSEGPWHTRAEPKSALASQNMASGAPKDTQRWSDYPMEDEDYFMQMATF